VPFFPFFLEKAIMSDFAVPIGDVSCAPASESGSLPSPGSWYAQLEHGTDGPVYYSVHAPSSRYRGMVATVSPAEHINGITWAEAEANARLIAAAPELLKALVGLLAQAPRCFALVASEERAKVYAMDVARAAIAKATKP
jgi:hypothetical protein